MTYDPQMTIVPWINAGVIILGSRVKATGAAGFAPTKGATVAQDAFRYKRIGDSMIFRAEYLQTAAGADEADAFYTFKLPGALAIDTAKQPVIGGGTITEGQMGSLSAYRVGDGQNQTAGGQDINTFTTILAYLANEFCVVVSADKLWDADSGSDFSDNPMGFIFTGIIPISGWA
jgi:hypothetical protein